MQQDDWGSRIWQETHFPSEQLDTIGDTWGIRWRGVEKLRHASYLRVLSNVLQQPQPLNVLDIGCALCDFTKKASALNLANQFWVMDIAENAISWVTQHCPQFEGKVAALPDIPFEVQFDVILCLEVLCYLEPDGRRETIRRIHSQLKPSGVLMFSGVLDDGQRYHTEDEMTSMIGKEFDIEHVSYNHWWFYKRVLEDPLNECDTILSTLRQQLEMPATEFDIRYPSRGTLVRVVRALRRTRPVSAYLLSVASRLVKWLLASRLLAELAQMVSRPVRGVQNADEIIILARKK